MRSAKKIALPLVVLASGLAASVPAWTESDASQRKDQHTNNDIVVEHVDGAVDVTVVGVAFDAAVGSVLGLPSRIATGSDGNISIRQSRTGVAIAPDSDVEIPEAARDGQLIARMIQHRGTAFYDVEPRPIEKLRVETPYLVAVVKGTQFSVLVEDGRTTISLFEGLLELRSVDDAEVVELAAGQIAIGVLDGGIRILPMDADLLPETAALGRDGSVIAPRAGGAVAAVAATSDVDPISIDDGAQASLSVRGRLDVASSPTGAGVDVGLDASADLGGGNVDVGLDAGLDTAATVGNGSVDVGLSAGLDAGADVGGGSVEIGLDAGLDVGTNVGSGSVDVGLDAGLDAGADIGAGSVDVGLDTSLDAGTDLGGGVDVGLDTALDVGTDSGGSIDVGLDAGLDSGAAVEADLGLGDLEIEAGLEADLGLGELDVEDTLGDLLDPGEDTDDSDTEEDESLLPDLPLPLF